MTLENVITMAKTAKANAHIETEVVVCETHSTIAGNHVIFGFFFENGLHVGYKGSHPNGDTFEVLAIV